MKLTPLEKASLEVVQVDLPTEPSQDERITRLRKEYPRAYLSWSPLEDALLLSLLGKKLNQTDLANMLSRQESAIKARQKKLTEDASSPVVLESKKSRIPTKLESVQEAQYAWQDREVEVRANRQRILAFAKKHGISTEHFIEVMLKLKPRDREVFMLRRNLNGLGNATPTLEQIALRYDLTRERIRQLDKRACKKLRYTLVRLDETYRNVSFET